MARPWRTAAPEQSSDELGVHDAHGAAGHRQSEVVRIETCFESAGLHLLKLKYDEVLSSFAFKFNMRRYIKAVGHLEKSTEVMGLMNGLINNKEVMQSMREMSKEMMKSGRGPLSSAHFTLHVLFIAVISTTDSSCLHLAFRVNRARCHQVTLPDTIPLNMVISPKSRSGITHISKVIPPCEIPLNLVGLP